MVALRVGSRARIVLADVGETGGYSWPVMLAMRPKGMAGAVGGGKISTRVGLAGGSGDKGTLGVWRGERCISLDRLYDPSDIYL